MMKMRSAGHNANQLIFHICCLILREKHFISVSSAHHRLRERLLSACPARGRRSLSQQKRWRWWRWWRWWWTADWFVPAGAVLVWRIKDALWNEMYFLLLGTIIMLKSIFNILRSMTPRCSFASLLSVNWSESSQKSEKKGSYAQTISPLDYKKRQCFEGQLWILHTIYPLVSLFSSNISAWLIECGMLWDSGA